MQTFSSNIWTCCAENVQRFISSLCVRATIETDLIATEMLAFPSKSSRNKIDSDPLNEKTTPIFGMMGIISIVNSNAGDQFSSLFLRAVRPSLSNPVLQYHSLSRPLCDDVLRDDVTSVADTWRR